ncbi:hypothetical protein COV61_03365 [Candidatus Micrarchaeota archaeon CG11_big_fil_rev_8_21_14_0_20_47_5]|nr:MAG: hypothetical protein AUJ17_02625 [Candidatus Micrarchaeota archaeon CG1_02_47_40]PIN83338.1 MAG: hypothetical protein COV61_03365 [Candidatus Micrarchaeota archaeon CG11_big_fil_rev_8_21_14_0_20_47_5]
MIVYAIILILGILLGVFSGLLPGLHPNTISAILAGSFSGDYLGVFIVALFGAQIMFAFIPSIFFGIPDSETVLSVLPGHRLAREGRGIEALKVCAISAVCAAILSMLLLPLALFLYPLAYGIVKEGVWILLLIAIAVFVLQEKGIKGKASALLVAVLSGMLGYLVLNSQVNDSLFPLFCGLFAVSGMLFAMKSRESIAGNQAEVRRVRFDFWKEVLLGTALGFFADLLPGISSPAQMALLGGIFFGGVRYAGGRMREGQKSADNEAEGKSRVDETEGKNKSDEAEGNDARKYLALIAAIAVSQGVFAFASLEGIGKARVGALAIAGETTGGSIYWMAGVFAIAIGMAALLLSLFAGALKRFDFGRVKSVYPAIIAYLALAVFLVCGIEGVAILAVSAIIGCLPVLFGVSRIHVMGCIIIPTVLLYLF